MRFRLLVGCVLISAATVALPVVCLAQSETGSIAGIVGDPKGAVVPDADVTATRIETNTATTTKTNGSGVFAFPALQPGHYRVQVRATGFKEIVLKDVELHIQDKLQRNFSLEIGSVSETVNVEGGIEPIDTQDATVSTVVDRQFVANLPLNGRSFQSLITLTPGVVVAKTSAQEQGQFSVNGQRTDSNYFTVDGVSANISSSVNTFPGQSGAGALPGLNVFGGTNNLVSVDALEEFRVQTSSFAPEFGRTAGAQVSIMTRSGTNQFHGTLFDYLRNDRLDANDWFANQNGVKKPALRQNDFGGVLGGRIVRDRTFFFFSYEGLRLRQPQVAISDVPSLAARQAAPTAILPLINMFPKPNGPNEINGLAVASYSFSNPTTLNAASIRLDERVSSNLVVFGRYNYAPSNSAIRGGSFQTLNSVNHVDDRTQTVTIGATFLPQPRLTNDLRFNYSRNRLDSFLTIDDFGGAVVPPDSTFFPSGISTKDGEFIAVINDGRNLGIFWGNTPSNVQRQLNVVDSVSASWHNHLMKSGVDYRRLTPVLGAPDYLQEFIFASTGTPGAPQTAGNVLSGQASIGIVASQEAPQFPVFTNLSLYAQDTWKAASRLTVTYGVRWEYAPPPTASNGSTPAAVTQVNDPATMSLAPAGTPLWRRTLGNFAPRIGIAYRLVTAPGRETVLRGGVGLFYDLGNGQASNAFAFAFPFTAQRLLPSPTVPLSPSGAAPPVPASTPTSSDSVFVFDPELKLPRVYEWNVTVQRALGASQNITASYLGAIGRRLLRLQTLTSPNPALLGTVLITKNSSTSDYHALQLQFQRRLARGLQGLVSYSWSKSLDTTSSDAVPGIRDDKIDIRLDRGLSTFDIPHVFSGAVTYNLPTPKLASKISGGWGVDTLISVHSGTPVNVVYSAATSFGTVGLRPDRLSGVPLSVADPNVAGGERFNANAFAAPSITRQGTLGRDVLRGFGTSQVDFSVRRQFDVRENVKLQFRTDFFNLFNHPNFANPSGSLGSLSSSGIFSRSPGFGISTSMLGRSLGSGGFTGGFSQLYQVGGPRSIQMSLKLLF